MFPSKFLSLTRASKALPVKVLSSSVVRYQSTSSKDLVLLDIDSKTGYATVTLNKPPVNSLNLEMLSAISKALDTLQNDKSKGMILTSSSDTVFSAGLDIMEMYKPEKTRLREFWSTLQDVWLKLYGSPYPTVAAINGHSPAGGCLLGLSCEYRIMRQNYTIGLNETKLGIVAPEWFRASMRNTIPVRLAEKALTLGTMFTTDEAWRIGLIDEIADDKADALARSKAFLDRFKKIPAQARALTKQQLRIKDIQALEDHRVEDVNKFEAAVSDPNVQKSLGIYIEALKAKK